MLFSIIVQTPAAQLPIESMAASDAVCLREMIEGLKADHRALEAIWARLRDVLQRIAAGETVPLAADDVEVLVGSTNATSVEH